MKNELLQPNHSNIKALAAGKPLIAWEFLQKLIEVKCLSPLDYAIAKELLQSQEVQQEPEAALISYMSLAAQQGHLCIKIDENIIAPAPLQLWQINGIDQVSIPEFEQIIFHFESLIRQGLSRLSVNLVSEIEESEIEPNALSKVIARMGDRYYFHKQWYYAFRRMERTNA